MKRLLLTLFIIGGAFTLNAQTYSFTLVQNNDYNYSVAAVPDFDSGTDTPKLESFAFTIMLQDGASIDQGTLVMEYLNLDSVSIFTAAQLDADDSGQDRSASIIASASGVDIFAAHLPGAIIPIVTFDVLGTPTNGEVSILDNGSALAGAAGGIFNSFFSADVTGGNNPSGLYAGQTGTTSYGFSTLGVPEFDAANVYIYPNPTNDIINIKLKNQENAIAEIYDLNGRIISQHNIISDIYEINLSNYNTGIYLLKINLNNNIVTKRIIKQ